MNDVDRNYTEKMNKLFSRNFLNIFNLAETLNKLE